MKRIFILAVLLSGVLFFAPDTNAQTISSQKGLTTAVFYTPRGNISIYLPDDIRMGDVISGRVKTEALGKNAKQVSKNLSELLQHSLLIDGEQVKPVNNNTEFKLTANRVLSGKIVLLDASGKTTSECKLPSTAPIKSTGTCQIPTHALCGSPIRITGSFDGDLSNTNCTVANNPIEILAESPRQCIATYPVQATGQQTVNCNENSKPLCSQKVSGVEMTLSAGKLNLLKGEKTHIDVKITGLENLLDTARLTCTNVTTGVVRMQPADQVIIGLFPDSVKGGTFNRRLDIQSLQSGGFTVNVNLDLPDVMLTPGPGDKEDGKCNCNLQVELVKRTTINPRPTFHAILKPSCTGKNCNTGTITKKWTIVSGQENGDIVDENHEKAIVTIQPKKSGAFILKFSATLTCSDGSTCTTIAFCNEKGENQPPPAGQGGDKELPVVYEKEDPKNPITWDSIPRDKEACNPTLSHKGTPDMVGGLSNYFIGTNKMELMNRDEYIVLEADGSDVDMAVITCTIFPVCPEAGCPKEVPISGKVRFEWKAVATEKKRSVAKGSFVQIGCLGEQELAKGEQVIFKPPYVPPPVNNSDTTVSTTVILYVIDAGSPVPDKTLEKTIEILVTRSKANPDQYKIKIKGEEYKPSQVAAKSGSTQPGCTCVPKGPDWTRGDNLVDPVILLPEESKDKDKLVQGQWVRIGTNDQTDMDIATYSCNTNCPTTTIKKSYHDIIRWKWKAEGGGRILLSDSSQFIVYEAPMDLPAGTDFLDIKLSVTVFNPPGRDDPEKSFSSEKVFRVFRAGIRLSYVDAGWFPEENNAMQFKSELVYQSGNGWLPAFDHVCRIQFFELMNVSQEKGICMNYPPPDKANQCFDLQFKKEAGLEVFSPAIQDKSKCALKDQFMRARTEKSVRETIVNVSSFDYGSFGTIRSFANPEPGMKNEKFKQVLYESIPARLDDFIHPFANPKTGGRKDKKTVYTDNRLSIPLDIDENHIPDSGWVLSVKTTAKGEEITRMPDYSKDISEDLDNEPVGDEWAGDGFSLYEEYRGFMVIKPGLKHRRTNTSVKDLFVYNMHDLPIDEFVRVTGIALHQISEKQYGPIDETQFASIKDYVLLNRRFINFNNGTAHVTAQRGLLLMNVNIPTEGLAGFTPAEKQKTKEEEVPAPPNYNLYVGVDREKIRRICSNSRTDGLVFDTKLPQIVAHELCHALNVYHHGEKKHAIGLTSGNLNCIMRYDNYNRSDETPGNLLCIGIEGANAEKGRGKCLKQIRVSGRIQTEYPGGYPKRE